MKPLETFLRLKPGEQKLILQALALLASCWVRMRLQSFERVQGWATRSGQGVAQVEQLTWAIKVASRRIPGVTCLSQALTLQHFLSRNGHCSELRIGVDKLNGKLVAHAWLVLDDRVLIGGPALENYKLLAAWSTRMALREIDQKAKS